MEQVVTPLPIGPLPIGVENFEKMIQMKQRMKSSG